MLDVVVIRAPRAGWRVGLQPRRSIKPCSGQVAVSADREELVAVRVWWRAIPVILAAGPMLRAYSSPTPRVLVRVHCVYSRALLLITAAARGATMFVGGRGVRFLRASNIFGSSRDISRRFTGVLLLCRGCYCVAVAAIATLLWRGGCARMRRIRRRPGRLMPPRKVSLGLGAARRHALRPAPLGRVPRRDARGRHLAHPVAVRHDILPALPLAAISDHQPLAEAVHLGGRGRDRDLRKVGGR